MWKKYREEEIDQQMFIDMVVVKKFVKKDKEGKVEDDDDDFGLSDEDEDDEDKYVDVVDQVGQKLDIKIRIIV